MLEDKGKKVIYQFKFFGNLDFLHARIIHDGTLNKKSFAEIYLVQFSINYNMPFFDVS